MIAAVPTFGLVLLALGAGYVAVRRRAPAPPQADPRRLPRWDIPVRMVAATAVVVLITTLAPFLGSHLAGLLSPFPVFGAVVAVFAHRAHGPHAATQTTTHQLRHRLLSSQTRGRHQSHSTETDQGNRGRAVLRHGHGDAALNGLRVEG